MCRRLFTPFCQPQKMPEMDQGIEQCFPGNIKSTSVLLNGQKAPRYIANRIVQHVMLFTGESHE